MRIAMMTNTYLPHVSGVANSVARFARAYQERGHEVLIVAPQADEAPAREDGVVRVPAIQHFNGSDFSVVLPVPLYLSRTLNGFAPDVIHSHHPFLIGDTAMRAATARRVPLVFTYHTMYEQYTHYVPFGAKRMQEFIIELSTRYCNRCDRVIVPSRSVGRLLRQRGVKAPLAVLPTGVDTGQFRGGRGDAARVRWGIPPDAPLLGYVSRLAPEKNLAYLARAVALCLRRMEHAHFIAAGAGPAAETMEAIFAEAGVTARTRFTGSLTHQPLLDVYAAMDVFAFSSQSETQGMVLVEAMAAGAPVVALDGPGVREIVRDRLNGRLLPGHAPPETFSRALCGVLRLPAHARHAMAKAARRTAYRHTTSRCAKKALGLYETTIAQYRARDGNASGDWESLLKMIEQEWLLWADRLAAASVMVAGKT